MLIVALERFFFHLLSEKPASANTNLRNPILSLPVQLDSSSKTSLLLSPLVPFRHSTDNRNQDNNVSLGMGDVDLYIISANSYLQDASRSF